MALKQLSELRNSPFIRHNAIFFAGSLLVGFLNYLYYPVLGRLMGPETFGEVQTLVSLFLQISVFLIVLGLLTINIIANADRPKQSNRIILEIEKLAILISIVVFVASIFLAPWLQRYFQFESSLPFSLLALAIVVTVPFTFRSGYLRGKQHFGHNVFALIAGAGSKLILSTALVIIGFSTAGAIFGIVLAQLIAFGYAARYARKYGFTERLRGQFWRLPDLKLIQSELKYAALVLAGSLAVTVMYSVDIVVVKHYFDAETAGLYAGIATVARILFFLTASVSQVLMPTIKLRLSAAENRRTLIKSMGLLALAGGIGLAAFYSAPKFFIGLLMGNDYLTYADLLPRLSLAIFIISALNLFLMYAMALRRYPAGFIAVSGALITYGLLLTSHQSLQAVINSLLLGSVIMLTFFAAWTAWRHRGFLMTARS